MGGGYSSPPSPSSSSLLLYSTRYMLPHVRIRHWQQVWVEPSWIFVLYCVEGYGMVFHRSTGFIHYVALPPSCRLPGVFTYVYPKLYLNGVLCKHMFTYVSGNIPAIQDYLTTITKNDLT